MVEKQGKSDLKGFSPLESFFNLGARVTKNDPLRKAKFDYYLYWIVFIAFVTIAVQYYYNFFFNNAPLSTGMWALVMSVFCWFNYQALCAFRGAYFNMKEMKARLSNPTPEKIENVNEMLDEFSDSKLK